MTDIEYKQIRKLLKKNNFDFLPLPNNEYDELMHRMKQESLALIKSATRNAIIAISINLLLLLWR